MLYKGPIVYLWGLFFLCSACTATSEKTAERLNDIAFAYHYRSLDSVRVYSDSVLNNYSSYENAYAEALNHLAFYYIGKMRYDVADSLLLRVNESTNNHIELCIASIYNMRLCQRQSKNKAYYEHRQQALAHFRRIHEEQQYTSRQRRRIDYAESEFRFVSSAYEYYVRRTDDAVRSLYELDSLGYAHKDTAQYLAYLYNVGSGGILSQGTQDYIRQTEYDYLMRCYVMAYEHSYTYWQANAMQSIAEHIIADGGEYFRENPSIMRYINTESVPDSILAGNVAERALRLFEVYGDVYQTAAAWRTLSQCYNQIGDYNGALYSLHQALNTDSALYNAPALMASIYERFSIEYSAIGKKQESDYYRNAYLDLYDNTRQDRQLEARADLLDKKVQRLNNLIYAIIALLVLLLVLLLFLIFKRQRLLKSGKDNSQNSFKKIQETNQAHLAKIEEEIVELAEQTEMMSFQLRKQEEVYIEQRARIHHINTIKPLLERMLHETMQLSGSREETELRNDRIAYVRELLARINEENDLLTRWIQIRRGELSIRIETFPLQDIFSVLSKNAGGFQRQGIAYSVEDTMLSVKADKALTLFMLNTLCDNARKHTPSGGSVHVRAALVENDMVEISVEDTGEGIDEQVMSSIFEIKPITDEKFTSGKSDTGRASHGFGLANCKGIIEKYKKTNSLFAHCNINVESRIGEGSRFFFSLPAGIKRVLAIIACVLSFSVDGTASDALLYNSLADSVYQCNIQRRHDDAIEYARLCLCELNKEYRAMNLSSADTLMLVDTLINEAAEVRWIRDSVSVPYQTILFVRNEIAVAALALNDIQLYEYNNSAYSQLFREYSSDKTLADYCRKMERTETDSNIAVGILIVLVLMMLPIYYFAYYRYVISDILAMLRRMQQAISEQQHKKTELLSRLDQLTYEHNRLHVANNIIYNSLSTLKHETMYYPSRIQQLINEADYSQVDHTARYYVEIYDTLSAYAQSGCQMLLPSKTLHSIALRTMARLSGKHVNDIVPAEQSAPYLIYHISVQPSSHPTAAESDRYVICMKILTQVARDLGELYNLRRCGIVMTDENTAVVTLPEEN